MDSSWKFQDYVDDINRFFVSQGLQVEPFPEVRILRGGNDRFDALAPTGSYDGSRMVVELYVGQRHLKDILRSYCHELVHHNQRLAMPEKFLALDKSGSLDENADLEKWEADAFRRGNLLFRRWTETKKPRG